MYEPGFSTSFHRTVGTAPSLTCAGSPLFCLLTICWLGSQSMFALFSLVRTFLRFLIYVNPGLVGPRGTLFVSFYSSRKQKLFPRARTAARRWQPNSGFVCQNPALCMASGHNAVLKYSFCFTRKATEFSFYILLPQLIGTINARSLIFGKDRCCRDLKESRANFQCVHYLFAKSFSLIGSNQSRECPVN